MALRNIQRTNGIQYRGLRAPYANVSQLHKLQDSLECSGQRRRRRRNGAGRGYGPRAKGQRAHTFRVFERSVMPFPTETSRRLRPNLLALACALSAAGALPVHAQTATDLDAVRVNAYRAANSASGATKTSTSITETPQSVSVIERAELDARGVQSLNDAMRYVAGVSLESSGIDNRVDDFRIRGFDAGSWSNNVTLDGMRAPQGSSATRSRRSRMLCDRPAAAKKNSVSRAKKRSRNSASCARALTSSSQPLGTVR